MNIKWKYTSSKFQEQHANSYLRDFNGTYTIIDEGIGDAAIYYYPRAWRIAKKPPLVVLEADELNIDKWSALHGSFEDFITQTMEGLSAGVEPNMDDPRFTPEFKFYKENYLVGMENIPLRKHADIYHCSAYQCKRSGEIAIPVSSINSGEFGGRRIGEPMTVFHSLIGRERFAMPTEKFLNEFEIIDYRIK